MSATILTKLREELRRLSLDGLLVPRSDEHLGEYVPPSAERLRWLTGFTGSAGLAVVLADRACAQNAVNQAVASLSRPLLTARAQTAGPSPSFARGWN